MDLSMLPPVRRIVTGLTQDNLSCIVEDGVSPAMTIIPGLPGFRTNSLWRTLRGDQPVDAPDSIMEHDGVLPPLGGTLLRVVDVPPEGPDGERQSSETQAFFEAVLPEDNLHGDRTRHPNMHATDTINYAILLEGELVAILDEDETVMRAGDMLIQRGTNHAFANRSDRIARMACVLVSGTR